jgi:hypothetical protein
VARSLALVSNPSLTSAFTYTHHYTKDKDMNPTVYDFAMQAASEYRYDGRTQKEIDRAASKRAQPKRKDFRKVR